MIWRAQVVKAIACGRLTGKSYPQIAEDMAEREILTKNNLRWQAGNLRRWTLKHVPELSEKRRWRLARWPYFAEEIVSEVWRWWKMTRPVAVYDGRGEVKTHHFYDFSQYTTRRRKSAPKNSTPAISQLALVKTERNLKGTKPIPLKLPEEWRGQDFTLALWRGDKLRLVRRDKHGKFYYQGHPAKFPSHFLKDDFTLWNHAEIDSIILQEIGVRRPSQTYRNSRCPFIISEVDVS